MKCTICGHSTMPGAMLCGPCRAALKRARYLSVQVVSPSSMMQGRPRRSRDQHAAAASSRASPGAARALAAHAAAAAVPPRPPLARTLAIAAAAVVALGVVAYVGQPPARDPVPLAEPAAAGARAVNVDAPAAQAGAGATGAKAALTATNSVLVSSGPADEGPPPAAKPVRPQRLPAISPARPTDSTVLAAGPAGAAYEMVPEPPRPAPIAPAPAPPPPPDRWQTMRDDLARCDREGGIGGFICDQRVRLATCEGHWGRVPQCPSPPENPR